eukprot:gene9038-biopygen14971
MLVALVADGLTCCHTCSEAECFSFCVREFNTDQPGIADEAIRGNDIIRAGNHESSCGVGVVDRQSLVGTHRAGLGGVFIQNGNVYGDANGGVGRFIFGVHHS